MRGVKLKYIKFMYYIQLVHVPLSACLSQTGLALVLISFNFFLNNFAI